MAAKDSFNRSQLGKHWVRNQPLLTITTSNFRASPVRWAMTGNPSAMRGRPSPLYLNGTDVEYGPLLWAILPAATTHS